MSYLSQQDLKVEVESEIEDIKQQFDAVIRWSQGIPEPKTDELFHNWYVAKKDFISAFGNQMIWTYPYPVTFELNDKEKLSRVDDFIEMVETKWLNPDLATFIHDQAKGFFANQVINVDDPKYKKLKIPRGMKLLKAFKFFEPDQHILEEIQQAASMIIQENKISGTLCLSVHPLDFLSISENTHHWRSCHSLDGEYRSGNLSYMVDSSTIICYLKSSDDEVLPNFPDNVPWNSKKWRVLLFFSEHNKILYAGRQYPFTTNTGLDFVRQVVLPKAMQSHWTEWTDKKIREFNGVYLYCAHVPVGDALLPIRDVIINEPGSLQFNDLLSSSCYDPMYCFNETGSYFFAKTLGYCNHSEKIHVGGAVKCLRCGKDNIELSETCMCNDCELEYGTSENDMFSVCPYCSCRYYTDDGVWLEATDETICSTCADEYTDCCDECGNRFFKDDLIFDRDKQIWVCKYCYEEEV